MDVAATAGRQPTDEGRRGVATRVAGRRWWRWREPGIRGHQAAAGWLARVRYQATVAAMAASSRFREQGPGSRSG